jgi:dTDP-4-dehydrorhamnose reductase
MKRVLLLGHTGKMGQALTRVLADGFQLVGANSRDYDARDPEQVRTVLRRHRPDVVINTAAFLGIDPCARDPLAAIALNTAYPRQLAHLANEQEFLLVHFSTDAVFPDRGEGLFVESDFPDPVNLYGATKLAGDWAVADVARRHYIARISVLFGPGGHGGQFVEKMLARAREGQDLRVADDIVASPCYSLDVAARVREMLEELPPYGLYHVANQGRASLYELMRTVVAGLGLEVEVTPASYRDFPAVDRKNTCTPLGTIKAGPLRPWQQAVDAYCAEIDNALNPRTATIGGTPCPS